MLSCGCICWTETAESEPPIPSPGWMKQAYFFPPLNKVYFRDSCWPAEIMDGPLKIRFYQYPPVHPSHLFKTQKGACGPASPVLGITRGLCHGRASFLTREAANTPWAGLLRRMGGQQHTRACKSTKSSSTKLQKLFYPRPKLIKARCLRTFKALDLNPYKKVGQALSHPFGLLASQ